MQLQYCLSSFKKASYFFKGRETISMWNHEEIWICFVIEWCEKFLLCIHKSGVASSCCGKYLALCYLWQLLKSQDFFEECNCLSKKVIKAYIGWTRLMAICYMPFLILLHVVNHAGKICSQYNPFKLFCFKSIVQLHVASPQFAA